MKPIRILDAPDSPVLIHAPHTSRYIPSRARRDLQVSDLELCEELDLMTDDGVADILRECYTLVSPQPGAAVATMSRLVFDPERFEVDPMESVGMGMVYFSRADGSTLRNPLTEAELDWYRAQYRLYAFTLEQHTQTILSRHGTALIVDLHSYSKDRLPYERHGTHRPEICIGTNSHHTPQWLVDAAQTAFASRFDTALNTPYAGTYVPGRLYGAYRNVLSIMVEARRDVATSDPAAVAACIASALTGASDRLTAA
jgi:N-formylglutamate deformylase